MFTCNVCRQELLAYLLSKAVIASAHTVSFGTVQQYHFVFIDNSTYALFFLSMSFRKHLIFTTVRNEPRRRTGRGQVLYPEIPLWNVFFEPLVEFDIKRFSRLSTIINKFDVGT